MNRPTTVSAPFVNLCGKARYAPRHSSVPTTDHCSPFSYRFYFNSSGYQLFTQVTVLNIILFLKLFFMQRFDFLLISLFRIFYLKKIKIKIQTTELLKKKIQHVTCELILFTSVSSFVCIINLFRRHKEKKIKTFTNLLAMG